MGVVCYGRKNVSRKEAVKQQVSPLSCPRHRGAEKASARRGRVRLSDTSPRNPFHANDGEKQSKNCFSTLVRVSYGSFCTTLLPNGAADSVSPPCQICRYRGGCGGWRHPLNSRAIGKINAGIAADRREEEGRQGDQAPQRSRTVPRPATLIEGGRSPGKQCFSKSASRVFYS